MSRSGYTDDCEDQWALIRWRGAVASAIRGRRGQAFLREALAALDALPACELIGNSLAVEGSFCTLGAVGLARGTDLGAVDPEDHERVAGLFNLPHALACEIMWENDEAGPYRETPRARWSKTIRPPSAYTHRIKRDRVPRGERLSGYELDHWIPLSLGGAPADPRNLVLQPWPEAKRKDRLENQLHRAVCAGRVTLRDAQLRMEAWR